MSTPATTLTGGKHGTKWIGGLAVASAVVSGIDPSALPLVAALVHRRSRHPDDGSWRGEHAEHQRPALAPPRTHAPARLLRRVDRECDGSAACLALQPQGAGWLVTVARCHEAREIELANPLLAARTPLRDGVAAFELTAHGPDVQTVAHRSTQIGTHSPDATFRSSRSQKVRPLTWIP